MLLASGSNNLSRNNNNL